MARQLSIEDANLSVSSISGTRNRLYSDIDLSLAVKPDGDIYKKTDAAAVKQAVKNLISTNYYEKPFQPKFGGNIRAYLFDLADDDTAEEIELAIKSAIARHESRARVVRVSAIANPDGNSIAVTIVFRVISTSEEVTFTTTMARLR